MSLPPVSTRLSCRAAGDVMVSSVSSCAATGCSVRVCSASGTVKNSATARFGDEFHSVAEPYSSLKTGIGLSSVRVRVEYEGLHQLLQSRYGDKYASSVRKRIWRFAAVAADDEEKGWPRAPKKDGGRWRAGRYATSITMQVDRFKLDQDLEKLLRRESRLLPEALTEALNKRIRTGEMDKALKIFELLRGQEWLTM
ncbi:hypothetical protein R1flu_000061 [Riccia fluitans]|uniref:Uncharacterized protein n=1 Tax=Riccia fluitans TaxID=41844 RepID=A0ABD1XZD5_9MARC